MNWLTYNLPIEVWVIGGLGLVFTVWRFFGLQNAIGAIIAFLLFIANVKGRQEGWKSREQKGRDDANKSIRDARNARADSDRLNSDPERLRDDDGFKRK